MAKKEGNKPLPIFDSSHTVNQVPQSCWEVSNIEEAKIENLYD